MSEHRHPAGDPGTGVDIETQRHRTVPDLAEDLVDVAAAEIGRTAEAEVGAEEMIQPRPFLPTKTDRKIGAAVRTDRKEVCQRRTTN